MGVFSCKGCGDRFPGCHSTCETYKAERAEYDALKAKRDFEKRIDEGLYQQRDTVVRKIVNGFGGYKKKGCKRG